LVVFHSYAPTAYAVGCILPPPPRLTFQDLSGTAKQIAEKVLLLTTESTLAAEAAIILRDLRHE